MKVVVVVLFPSDPRDTWLSERRVACLMVALFSIVMPHVLDVLIFFGLFSKINKKNLLFKKKKGTQAIVVYLLRRIKKIRNKKIYYSYKINILRGIPDIQLIQDNKLNLSGSPIMLHLNAGMIV